jgi:TRAP-type mannitol/chloroaromatic compound transport system permease large subunit
VAILIFATLGSILVGLATPTEAAACGVFRALILTFAYRRMSWSRLQESVYRTIEISTMILFLVASSNFFDAVFSRLGSATMLTKGLLSLPFMPIIMLLLILGLIFVLGRPLEWVPIVLIIVPILLTLVPKLNIDMVWFCTQVAVTLQTAWLSRPTSSKGSSRIGIWGAVKSLELLP